MPLTTGPQNEELSKKIGACICIYNRVYANTLDRVKGRSNWVQIGRSNWGQIGFYNDNTLLTDNDNRA